MCFVALLVIANVFANHVYNNGILLNARGNFFTSSSDLSLQVNVERPLPSNILADMDFESCACVERVGDSAYSLDKTECKNKIVVMFDSQLQTVFENRIEILQNETYAFKNRRKRSAFTILGNILNFGWNAAEQLQIHNLKHIALGNADSAAKLATALDETQQQIRVIANNSLTTLHHFQHNLCTTNEYFWETIARNHAHEVIEAYFEQIESETLSLLDNTVPQSFEYASLVKGICLKSCSTLSDDVCNAYCSRLDRPEYTQPEFVNVTSHGNATTITFNIRFPKLSSSPRPLFEAVPFGTSLEIRGALSKRTPVISRYAAEFNRKHIELDTTQCQIIAADFVCKQPALIFDSCLYDVKFCVYSWRTTRSPCTYIYNSFGVAVSSSTIPIHVSNTDRLKEVGVESESWIGTRFIPFNEVARHIQCGNTTIIIPIKPIEQTMNVTIHYPEPRFNTSEFVVTNLHPIHGLYKSTFADIYAKQEAAHKSGLIITISIIGALVMVLIGTCIGFCSYRRMVVASQGQLAEEIMSLRPVV